MMERLLAFIKSSRNTIGWKKWFVWIAVVAALALAVCIFIFRTAIKSYLIARLQNERDITEERARQERVVIDLNRLEQSREEHKQKTEEALEQVRQIDEQIKDLTDSHKENLDAIANIHSWDDVDRIVK